MTMRVLCTDMTGTLSSVETSLTHPVDCVIWRVDVGCALWHRKLAAPRADKLMDEEGHPVCSPKFLRQHWRLRRPNDLAREIFDPRLPNHTTVGRYLAIMPMPGRASGEPSR